MNPTNPSRNKKYIFLDSCIIQIIGSKIIAKSDAVILYLKSLEQQGYNLAISEFSIYENQHGLWGKEAITALEYLKSYEAKSISVMVLLVASALGGLYHEEKLDGVDTGDKIIAATAILENGLILTENHKDYPSPFFVAEQLMPITFQFKSYQKTIDLGLYKPQGKLIARRIEEHEKI